jgi:RimJ/RimL family protein N-acetyltransferase
MEANSYAFIIVTKNDEKPVGVCRLKEVDLINRRASLGIFIGEKSCWNKGIGTEAIKLLLDFGFNVLNLQNVMLQVYSFNERAVGAYEKCGFKEFGRRRKAVIHGSREYDEIYMDILSSEFKGSMFDNILK